MCWDPQGVVESARSPNIPEFDVHHAKILRSRNRNPSEPEISWKIREGLRELMISKT
jgi:hypothetical protein